jgi:hypothetical protein
VLEHLFTVHEFSITGVQEVPMVIEAALLELVVWSLGLVGVVTIGIVALPWGEAPSRAAAQSLVVAGERVARWVLADPIAWIRAGAIVSSVGAGRGRVTS